jgi:hypothetical protein
MDLSINSGTGTNYGEYIVEFDDTKQKIHFMSPGGEVTGVTYGNRTFNFTGKGIQNITQLCFSITKIAGF